LIEVMGGLEDQGIGFHSVTEFIDTTTPGRQAGISYLRGAGGI
jgi:hypothetical protein